MQPGGDTVEQGAHGRWRQTQFAWTVGDNTGEGSKQYRIAAIGTGIAALDPVEPVNLRRQAQNLTDGKTEADQQHAEDQAIQRRIGHEGAEQGSIQKTGQHKDGDEKYGDTNKVLAGALDHCLTWSRLGSSQVNTIAPASFTQIT